MKTRMSGSLKGYILPVLSGLLILGSLQAARASTIPYPTAGTYNNTSYTFIAGSTGTVEVYFAGTDALYDNTLMVYANNILLSDTLTNTNVLFNKTSAIGDKATFTGIAPGAVLTFVIESVYNGNTYDISSVPGANLAYDNNGGVPGNNHIYVTPYIAGTMLSSQPYGGSLTTGFIPVNGTYIGFEDQSFGQPGGSDYSYNDEDFVFTGLRRNEVPEPATLVLFGFGVMGLGALRKRMHK